jgi:hypothetical protein
VITGFNNNEQLKEGVKTLFSSQVADFFGTGIQTLIAQCVKCGDHAEKQPKYVYNNSFSLLVLPTVHRRSLSEQPLYDAVPL